MKITQDTTIEEVTKVTKSTMRSMSTTYIIAPTKNIVDLIHYKGMINNTTINLNSKLYNENDIGFEIYVSALK